MKSFWEIGEENKNTFEFFRSVIMANVRGVVTVMVTVLVSGLSGAGGRYCVVNLSTALYYLHPGVVTLLSHPRCFQ